MSQSLEADQVQIIKKQLLPTQWNLWFSYSCDSQNGINYGNNLMQVQKVNSWNQFILLWKWVAKTENFFINPQDGSFKKYKFGLQERKIDSINFFKNDIQPTWEYEGNSKYGYFNFGIQKEIKNIDQIFQASVYLGVGQAEEWASQIFGVRIIDLSSKKSHPCRARIEIWVKFRHDRSKESWQKLLGFQEALKKYYKESINQDINQLKFFNISQQQGEDIKTSKKQYMNKSDLQYKNNRRFDKNKN